MRKASSGITAEGLPSIGLCSLAAFLCAVLGWWLPAVLAFGLVFFCCHFFRDPERVVPSTPAVAVSPADGHIINISSCPDPFTGAPRQCIAIFMNVFSVHVNRAPVAGTITAIAYHPGAFLNASWDKAAHDNERCAYAITDSENNAWAMVQIAGLIARRIVCRVEEGEALARGERFGMIKFGSRVDLYLPEGYCPSVTIGSKVFAGQTILAARK